MQKVVVVVGTNRNTSFSEKIGEHYMTLLNEMNVESEIVKMEDLPRDFIFSESYGNRTEAYENTFVKTIAEADKYVFILPEYNGGIPGVVKAFVDTIPPKYFHNKKAALVGVSSGHAGNLRGMDAFTNVLNYLKVSVLYAKPKLSAIPSLFDGDVLTDQRTIDSLHLHAQLLLDF